MTDNEKRMIDAAASKLGISSELLIKLKALSGNPELAAKLDASVTAIEGDAASANFRHAFKTIRNELIESIKAIGKPMMVRFAVVETTNDKGETSADLSVEIVDKEKRATSTTGGKKGKKSDSELAECKRNCANALRDKPGNINNACKAGNTTALTLKKYIAAETDETGFVAKYADKSVA